MKRTNTYSFPAVFTAEVNGSYSVRFPQLDGCYTQGNSFDEAHRKAIDAMSLHLYGMEQDGESIPEAKMNIKTAEGEMIILVTAWMTPFRDQMENRTIKKTLTLPAWLNEAAEQRGVNFSQILQSALKDYLGIYHP